MKTVTSTSREEVAKKVPVGPSVSITLSFNPKMNKSATLQQSIAKAVESTEIELLRNHCDDMGMLVIQKMKLLFQHLNYNTYKKSVALFVSPFFEKLLYLDFEVERSITISESFKVRDLLSARKPLPGYLVLFISEKEGHMYQASEHKFTRIATITPVAPRASLTKPPVPVTSPYSSIDGDPLAQQFLERIDRAVTANVGVHHIPIIVVGPQKTIARFRQLTRHEAMVVQYIPLEQEQLTVAKLKQFVGPLVQDWEAMREEYLLNRIAVAQKTGRLATGIQLVREQVMKGKGKLLVIEACFPSSTNCNDGDSALYRAIGHYSKYSYIQDGVDEVIEKLLETGAEVEIVPDGLLSGHEHIALIL